MIQEALSLPPSLPLSLSFSLFRLHFFQNLRSRRQTIWQGGMLLATRHSRGLKARDSDVREHQHHALIAHVAFDDRGTDSDFVTSAWMLGCCFWIHETVPVLIDSRKASTTARGASAATAAAPPPCSIDARGWTVRTVKYCGGRNYLLPNEPALRHLKLTRSLNHVFKSRLRFESRSNCVRGGCTTRTRSSVESTLE
jgi:hypothetical protein